MSKIPFCEARGMLKSINDCLVSDQASMWLEVFKRVLRRENPWAAIGRSLGSTKVGVLKTHECYLKAFKDARVRVSPWAQSIFYKVWLAQTEVEYALVDVSGEELGFSNLTRFDVICKRALEFGLGLVPAEAALAFRLAHLDQPKGEWLVFAMDALTVHDGSLNVFRVGRGVADHWLETDGGAPGHKIPPGRRLVFVRCK